MRGLAAMVATAALGLGATATAPPASAVTGYQIAYVDWADLHSGPADGYPVTEWRHNGAGVDIVCQTRGEGRMWDRLRIGSFVRDSMVNTPNYDQRSPGLAWCDTTYADGSLLRAPWGTVYNIRADGRYVVPDGGEIDYCLGGWGKVQNLNDAEIDWMAIKYPDRGPIYCTNYPDGTQLRGPDDPAVRVILGNRRYLVTTPEVSGCLERQWGGTVRWISEPEYQQMMGNVPDSSQQASCSNSAAGIADIGLRYVGRNGEDACTDAGKPSPAEFAGQCKQFVNCVVYQASGGRFWLAPGFYSQYTANGYQVDAASAARGDVIQLNNDGDPDHYHSGMHTAIVVASLGGGNFDVVDSNFGLDLKVHHHVFNPYDYARAHLLSVHIWRLRV